MIFPIIDQIPRHPSQLYEATLEGIILFLIMIFLINKENYKIGTCSSFFLIFYSLFRIIVEQFRAPDVQLGYLFGTLSMGTILCSIMFIFGLIINFRKK